MDLKILSMVGTHISLMTFFEVHTIHAIAHNYTSNKKKNIIFKLFLFLIGKTLSRLKH